MKSRDEHIAFNRAYCKHYDPSGITMIGDKESHGYCKTGVVYLDQFGRAPRDSVSLVDGKYFESAGIFQRICCTSGNKRTEAEQLAACPKWERRTVEQAEKLADSMEAAMNRMRVVMPVVARWRTWTKKNRVGKAEVIECPMCKGRLHLSQSSYNGHVHGQCETRECVSWME